MAAVTRVGSGPSLFSSSLQSKIQSPARPGNMSHRESITERGTIYSLSTLLKMLMRYCKFGFAGIAFA